MAARRNRRRQRRNRGRFGFLYKVLSIVLILAAILMGCIVFFRVDTVAVDGNSPYTKEEVITAAGVERGDNLFALNTVQMKKDIVRTLPYMDEVSIRRKLPDTLLITVTESRPVAVIQGGGAYWLIDSRCKLLEKGGAELAKGRPEVLGLTPLAPEVGTSLVVAEEEQVKLERLNALLAAIRDRQMTGSLTGFLDLQTTNRIYFGYGPELTAVFPMNADFEAKTFALRGTLLKMDEEGVPRTGTLYLTYGEDEARLLSQRWLPEQLTAPPQEAPAPEEPTPAEQEKKE